METTETNNRRPAAAVDTRLDMNRPRDCVRIVLSISAMKRLALLSLLLVAFCSSALAWSGEGHMVIAAIAYKELTPEAKTKVNALLKSHPDYSKWTNSFAGDFAGMDMETYVFLRASPWPDEIRRKKNSYDHPQWHYIDYPLR